MSERIELMESCLALAEKRDGAALPLLLERLRHNDWRVRYAAAVALGELRDAGAVPGLLEALERENAAPLYGQKEEYGSAHAGSNGEFRINLPAGLSNETIEAWRRRGRLKQAICLTLGELKAAAEPARAALERLAIDPTEDPMVHAAAAKALGLIANPLSLPVLQKVAQDQEWCTKTEGEKGLRALNGT